MELSCWGLERLRGPQDPRRAWRCVVRRVPTASSNTLLKTLDHEPKHKETNNSGELESFYNHDAPSSALGWRRLWSDSRYQISAPGHCIITVNTTLLNEDDNREWRCEVTHRNQVKTSVTYTVKSSGTSGVDDTHVFISSGENVCLPCNNDLRDCTSTTWNCNNNSAAVELFAGGKKKNNIERHERLSLGSDCSLNIKNITKEDYGLYTCQQWTVNGQKKGTDARVYLHVLHVSSSSSQTEISAGSSVTLSCQLFSYSYSYAGVSCDDSGRSEGIQLFWVNQAGVNLTISDSRYQESAPGHCIITLTTTLLNEDDNREWRCEVTHRNQVKISVTYTVKSSGEKTISSIIFRPL
ncbi:uncharacterized protein LOC127158680 [Labeo rohita]|uniref:uncharacterized protein LOC127158680 n=1 Tax=Labeo rohita TaxID=84645 RepID=UPI0021E1DAC9|nr:uncharacterized protein LOC127158680 [Labeo rohita]